MKRLKKSHFKRVAAMLMVLLMVLSPLSNVGALRVHAADLSIADSKGYEEGVYAKWSEVTGADNYKAYVSSNGGAYEEVNSAMVRKSGDYYRVDEVGLAAGSYTIKVEALSGSEVIATATTDTLTVTNYDRSGYAHFNYTDGVGAYKDDGTLKDNAIVLYVTDANKNTVSVTSKDGTTVEGIGHILNSSGQDKGSGQTGKGGAANNNQGIIGKLAEDGTPLVVRIIGTVTAPEGVTAYNSVDYGGSTGDNGYMARMQSGKDITIEGIGSDATIDGWGIHFIRQSSDTNSGKSFEVRNITFRNVPEDCVGMEGVQDGTTLSAPVERCWVHDCAFYAPSIANPAESDKAGGDGACDFKRGQYFTNSYCYYEGYHKTNLVGASDDNLQFHITYHHNYWKNCESRGPLARQANIHMYNNLFEGQTSYCMNPRANAFIFSEYNTLINCKNPVELNSGGVVKSYKDAFTSCTGNNQATQVSDKSETVSSDCTYANFDTNSSLSYIPSGNYQLQTDLAVAKTVITAKTGPLAENPISSEDVDTSVIEEGRMPAAAVSLPYNKSLNKTYVTAASSTVDNIVFNVSKLNNDSLTVGGNAIGQDIVFKVDTAVNVTMEVVSGTYVPVLCNEAGISVLNGGGTAQNLPAGVYFIQSGGYDVGSAAFKEAKIASLSIEEYDPDAPEYSITVQNDGNGTASANVSKATKGTAITLTATPNSGYIFDSWEVVSGGVTITSNKFNMPANDVVVRALFKEYSTSGGTGYVHNFTESELTSSFYTFTNCSTSNSKGSTSYAGLTLTKCLKMESETNVSFTYGSTGTLILVLDANSANSVKVDGVEKVAVNGVVTVDITTTGTHTIAKKSSDTNCFYMEFIPAGGESGEETTVPVTGVSLDKTSATLTEAGATVTLKETVLPETATNKEVEWRSNNTGVATVDNGVVTAVANGTATITVTTADGSKTATCLVTVAISAENGGEVDEEITVTESKGYQESAYVEWEPVSGAIGYKAYVAKNGGSYTQLDNQLIRQYASYWRADAVGLAAGTYSMKIEAVMSNGSIYEEVTGLTVIAYDRSGYAWVDGTASGAYNEDGTLKSDAIVLYITENTKDTVTLDVVTSSNGSTTETTGLQNILYAYKKGYDSRPLAIRLIGNVTDPATLDGGDIVFKGNSSDKRLSCGITFEGIGEDATCNGWGIRLNYASNVEIRNLGFMNCDSNEGDSVSVENSNDHVWVHDNDFFYGGAGSDADQVKGDGSLDTKKSTHVTHSYNHFWDTGKTHLNGNGDEIVNYLTYHHNWYDHSDSRHPLVRCSSAVHVYNNLYDGVSKYGMIARLASSIFSEANYFKDTKEPMLISQQGTDMADGKPISTDDNGGMIKSYGNVYDNTTAPVTHKTSATDFDCYEATTRDEVVPDSYVTLVGGNTYSNFDTAEGFYTYSAQTAAAAKTTVENYAGRVNGGDFSWDFSAASEDTNYEVITGLKTALANYTSGVISIGGMSGENVDPGTGTVYTITVDKADGSATTSFTVSAGTAITSEMLPTPERESYIFTGWVDSKGNAVVLPYTPTGNMTIKATWQQESGGGSETDPDALYNLSLKAENIPAGTYTAPFTKNGFTVTADEINTVTVDSSSAKTINGVSYSYRLKTSGTGTKDYRSIYFTAQEAATLEIGCISSSSSATRKMGVATLDAEGNFVDLTEGYTINGAAATYSEGVDVAGDSGKYITVAIPAAGTYYIYSKGGGINFYFLNLIYENGVDAPQCTVTFNAMGGLSVDPQTVNYGDACSKPADSLRAGYTFAGWYSDYNCTVPYDFATPVTQNITLFAKWTEGETGYTHLVLDMKDLPARDYKEQFSKNGFTFQASESKHMSVDGSAAEVDGVAYTKRLKLNGTGSTSVRSIAFTVTENSVLTLVAASGSSGVARALTVTNGTTTYTVANIDGAAKFTQELAAGTWDVYSADSGVNIYYIAVEKQTVIPKPDGLYVELANPDEEYIYTGSAIKPEIIVYNNGEELTAGVDYVVKYSGNVNASTDKKKAKITVTGKGNLTGSTSTTFDILPKNIADEDVVAGEIIIAKNTVPAPVLIYNNKKLSAKDYTKVPPVNTKYAEDGVLEITGKGNFTGSRSLDVKVVDKKELKKFTVTVDTKTPIIYNGEEQIPAITVKDSKDKTKILTLDQDYIIDFGSYSTVNAGSVKFTVIGIGEYTGSILKAYTIKPLAIKEAGLITYDASAIDAAGYSYVNGGVKIDEDIIVKYGDTTLVQGKDYKVTYANNKKISTEKAPAKFTVNFIGNYKGSKAITGTFVINSQPLSDDMDGIKIVAADKIYTKANVYKSAPIVTIDGVVLKASNYIVKYYTDSAMTEEMTSKNKVEIAENASSATVYVKITGKGCYAPVNGEYATAEYQVVKKAVIDISKAKVTFVDGDGNKLSKMVYTGKELEPNVVVEVKQKVDGKMQWVTVDASKYEITYTNNVKKGTATVVVTGITDDCTGSKNAKFKIVAKNLKSLPELLKDLFGL